MEFFDTPLGTFIIILAQCLAVTLSILVSLAFLLLVDRKVWAAVQLRRGPNVVGPVRAAAKLCGFWQIRSQRDRDPRRGRQSGVPAGPFADLRSGGDRLGGNPIRSP